MLLRSGVGDARFWRRWQQLRTGAEQLFERLGAGGNWQLIDEDSALMSRSFERACLLRALASLVAQQLPHATTLTITHAVAGKEQAIVVGGKTGSSIAGEGI